MRQTVYYPGYGYVTSYDGGGIFSDLFNFAQKTITSDAAKNIAVEAGKSFAKTAGTKAGKKLVDKVLKDNSKKTVKETQKPSDIKEPKPSKKLSKKKTIKDMKVDLDEIYGDGLFSSKKHVGRGFKRL